MIENVVAKCVWGSQGMKWLVHPEISDSRDERFPLHPINCNFDHARSQLLSCILRFCKPDPVSSYAHSRPNVIFSKTLRRLSTILWREYWPATWLRSQPSIVDPGQTSILDLKHKIQIDTSMLVFTLKFQPDVPKRSIRIHVAYRFLWSAVVHHKTDVCY
jgi:hypothetical protein